MSLRFPPEQALIWDKALFQVPWLRSMEVDGAKLSCKGHVFLEEYFVAISLPTCGCIPVQVWREYLRHVEWEVMRGSSVGFCGRCFSFYSFFMFVFKTLSYIKMLKIFLAPIPSRIPKIPFMNPEQLCNHYARCVHVVSSHH